MFTSLGSTKPHQGKDLKNKLPPCKRTRAIAFVNHPLQHTDRGFSTLYALPSRRNPVSALLKKGSGSPFLFPHCNSKVMFSCSLLIPVFHRHWLAMIFKSNLLSLSSSLFLFVFVYCNDFLVFRQGQSEKIVFLQGRVKKLCF